MGSKPAPILLAILFFYYEWQYINNHKKGNVISALKFSHIFRFIDNLIAINGNFVKNICNNYPAELELKKENQINKNAYFKY